MKNLSFLLLVCSFITANAQNPIPNPGFETYWASNPGRPNGWTDSRDISQISPGSGISGFAAQGIKTLTPSVNYPAFVTSSGGNGIPVLVDYSTFNLNYKFNSNSSDKMTINVQVFNASKVVIGTGVWTTSTSTTTASGVFTPLSIPIYYSGSGASEVIISVLINDMDGISNPHAGTNFIIDDLELSGAVSGISESAGGVSRLKIFPNPASGFLQVELPELETRTVSAQLIDMSGKVVKDLDGIQFADGKASINVSLLPKGNYSLAIKNKGFIRTETLVID